MSGYTLVSCSSKGQEEEERYEHGIRSLFSFQDVRTLCLH